MTQTAEMPISHVAEASLSNWTDSRLVRECLNGNQEAWSGLIRRYKNLIFSVPLAYGLTRDDAADVFQTVCAELLSELPKLREPRSLPKWILMVTSHKCFHRKTSDQKSQASAEEMRHWFRKELPAEADEIVQRVEREQVVRDAVSKLPPQCQQFVHVLFCEEPARPYSEIAKELGLATRSIGLTRQGCLGQLRRKLGKVRLA
jgi:RNA polymerase sigma factor (sigma-70 family)